MTAETDLLPLPSGNVAHLIAAQSAEIEALRLRIAGLRQVAENDRARAERLAEALRHQRWCRTCAEDGWESCEEGRKNDALLRDQEEGHEQ